MPIKVLVVDDSPTARQIMAHMLTSDPDMQIVGQAGDGLQAVEMVAKLLPDVVLMDVTMPRMGGLDATREIMHETPTPIVLISANAQSEADLVFRGIRAGALSVLQKPSGPGTPDYHFAQKELVDTVRAMAGVRVIRHALHKRTTALLNARALAGSPLGPALAPIEPPAAIQPEIVAIASSTGGPQTLAEILKPLPRSFRLPVVIVQHISADFVGPLVDWLHSVLTLPVHIAQPDERPRPGIVYIAPGGAHLRLTSDRRFTLAENPRNVPHIPSGDVLLESVAHSYGARSLGVVLTGMGRDGAEGLRAMFDAGAMSIAQDAQSCVVFGMPQEAIKLGAARQVLAPPEIANVLLQYAT